MSNIKPADRLSAVQEYYFSRKLKEVAALNAQGKDIISLAIGSPDMPPSRQTVEALCQTAEKPAAHGYQPTMGIPELREAMANFYKRWYGVDLDPRCEIQPLIGSKEGILHTTLAFCNVGDEVLVPNPGYPTYTSLSKILGAKVVNYSLSEDNGWQPDFDELEAMDLSRVKLMWTNYPNMPTGGNARMETYERLVDFARRHSIVVVNDNPYSFILNEGQKLSILQVPGAKDCCIEFNSMSKSHNMPGWRVGMCASNAEFISWILKIKSNIDSGTFRGIQLAAAEARCSMKELSAVLFGDDQHRSYMYQIRLDLVNTLNALGVGDIISQSHGYLGVMCSKVKCDYYDYLDHKIEAPLREYMTQYSFGEQTFATLFMEQL